MFRGIRCKLCNAVLFEIIVALHQCTMHPRVPLGVNFVPQNTIGHSLKFNLNKKLKNMSIFKAQKGKLCNVALPKQGSYIS